MMIEPRTRHVFPSTMGGVRWVVPLVALIATIKDWALRPWALRLALWSLPFGLILGPLSSAAWDLGAQTPTRPGPEWLAVWLAQQALDRMGGQALPSTLWGGLHAVSVLPVLLTMMAVRERLLPTWGRAGSQVVIVAFLVGFVAMLNSYTVGFGFPLDLLAFLVAATASVVLGVRMLVRRKGPRSLGWLSSAGMLAALGVSMWWCGPYVPAFVVLGLTLAWGAIGVRTVRWAEDTPQVIRASTDTVQADPA